MVAMIMKPLADDFRHEHHGKRRLGRKAKRKGDDVEPKERMNLSSIDDSGQRGALEVGSPAGVGFIDESLAVLEHMDMICSWHR